MKRLYISYGSNMNLEQMARRCPKATVLGKTKVNGYRLMFRGQDGNAVATIEKEKGSTVPVVLWEITPSDEVSLDRYEGYPYLYRKEMLSVEFRGETIQAMVYIMNDGRPLGLPNDYYYEVIKTGYKSAKIKIDALDEAVEFSKIGVKNK